MNNIIFQVQTLNNGKVHVHFERELSVLPDIQINISQIVDSLHTLYKTILHEVVVKFQYV